MVGKKITMVFKKAVIIFICIMLLLAIGMALYSGVNMRIYRIKMAYVEPIEIVLAQDAQVDNVILMIGDGMGANHIEATKAYTGKDKLDMETLALHGEVSTFSKGGVTDSAAAATALSTGTKIFNGGISMEDGKNLETLSEFAIANGKSVGIISTDELVGATPSGFSGHATARNFSGAIADSQLNSGIDLFMGKGKSLFDNLDVESYGYDYVNKYSDLDSSADKIFACFDNIPPKDGSDAAPLLSELVSFAIDYLEAKSDDGYFLMVEGANIDKKSHPNDMQGMLYELIAFDEAVTTVISMVQDDTYVMVTADHETGDLRYNGETGSDINNKLFHSGSHTGKNVRYFATAQITNLPPKIDNTNIAQIYRQLILS